MSHILVQKLTFGIEGLFDCELKEKPKHNEESTHHDGKPRKKHAAADSTTSSQSTTSRRIMTKSLR